MTVPYQTIFDALSPERQARVKVRARELIAEEYALRDLRKARQMTQAEVAEQLGGRQVYVSRLEKRSDMKLSTLRSYVAALGGELQVMVPFPQADSVRLRELGQGRAGKARAVRAE